MASSSSTNAPNPSGSSSGGSADDAYLKKQQSRGSMTLVVAVLVILVLLFAALAGAYALGYIGKSNNKSNGSGWLPDCGGSLLAGGSTFVYPIMAVWTTTYAGQACSAGSSGFTSTQINYQSVGSGSGVTSWTDGLYLFGASDAPLTYTQTQALKSPSVTLPDSAGAVTVMYNLKVTNATGVVEPLKLTGQIIAAIYLGDITTWNNTAITTINPGLTIPGTTIAVQHRLDGSGTSYAFSTFLSDSNSTWKTKIGASTLPAFPVGIGWKGSEGVTGAVATNVGSIGYAELNYAEEGGTSISLAEVQNPAGNYILPSVADTAYAVDNASNLPAPTGNWSGYSLENSAGAGTYPIVSLTYLMIYTDIGKAPVYNGAYTATQATALVDFVWWITHGGQTSATGLFYVPLSPVLVAEDEAAIGDIQYNGAALVSHAPS